MRAIRRLPLPSLTTPVELARVEAPTRHLETAVALGDHPLVQSASFVADFGRDSRNLVNNAAITSVGTPWQRPTWRGTPFFSRYLDWSQKITTGAYVGASFSITALFAGTAATYSKFIGSTSPNTIACGIIVDANTLGFGCSWPPPVTCPRTDWQFHLFTMTRASGVAAYRDGEFLGSGSAGDDTTGAQIIIGSDVNVYEHIGPVIVHPFALDAGQVRVLHRDIWQAFAPTRLPRRTLTLPGVVVQQAPASVDATATGVVVSATISAIAGTAEGSGVDATANGTTNSSTISAIAAAPSASNSAGAVVNTATISTVVGQATASSSTNAVTNSVTASTIPGQATASSAANSVTNVVTASAIVGTVSIDTASAIAIATASVISGSATRTAKLTPISDDSNDGWKRSTDDSTSGLNTVIDEPVADDNDYAYSPWNPVTSKFREKLASTTGLAYAGTKLSYRYACERSGGSLTVRLYQGSTPIASATHNNVAGFVEGSIVLSPAERAAITDPSDLHVEFEAN